MAMSSALLALTGLLALSGLAMSRPAEVIIASGVIAGTTTSLPSATATVNQFLGIPFASSPPERFSPPTRPAKWYQPLQATSFKPACIQQFNFPAASRNFTMLAFNTPAPQESEDCLYLNVFTPSTRPPPGGYPVMFWIYGGALEFGNAGQPTYDGSFFAAFEDVIVVTTNYRTNVFGFPNSPALPITGQNLGFLDQRFALDWVQQNIYAFGGNPTKVTIFGESAGAESVDALVNSFPKNPPFRAAIMESGTQELEIFESLGTNSEASWLNLTASLRCTTIACVRAAPATTIKSIIENFALPFRPVIDGVTFIANATAARIAGNVARVPILEGTNGQEGRVFVVGMTNLTAFISTDFGFSPALAAQVAQAYAIGTEGTTSGFEAIAQLYTELVFQCPQARAAIETAATGTPVWRYLFNASFPNIAPIPGLAAFHSSEIPLVFSTYPRTDDTAQEFALSEYMRGAWARFARNPTDGPGWNAIGTFDGTDLGLLGTNGTSGVTVISESVVDSRCSILSPFYLAVGE